MNFGFKEEMGFEVDQVKTLFVAKPRLWLMSKYCSFWILLFTSKLLGLCTY